MAVVAALLCLPGARSVAAAAPLVVAPGAVVRWDGAGTESCRAAGRTFAPIGGTCWFAIDLLEEADEIELERTRRGVTERTVIRLAPYPYPVQRLSVAEEMVHLSEDDLARVDREAERVRRLWQLDGPARFDLPLEPPLEGGRHGGNFGARRILNDEPRSPHSGIDYAAPAGTPVRATATGTVVLAEDHFFAGSSVFIDHGGGLVSMYFHLASITVEPGREVARGEVIGTVGATGRATGPHLHFGLRWHGARVDPNLLLDSIAGVPTVPR